LATSHDSLGRWVGIRGIGKMKNPDLIPDLIVALNDENCRVRDAAIRALCYHERPAAEALPILAQLSDCDNRCTPGLVDQAMRKIKSGK
jgi:HEAT repeat protein